MGADFTVTLLNGRKTDVYFLSTIKELSEKLSAYGRRVLWVFDSNSASLFTSLPANSVILPSSKRREEQDLLLDREDNLGGSGCASFTRQRVHRLRRRGGVRHDGVRGFCIHEGMFPHSCADNSPVHGRRLDRRKERD